MRHRRDGARHLGGGPQQIVDQRIDRCFHLAPGTIGEAQLHAFAGATLAADDLTHALELLCQCLISGNDFVEGIGDLSLDTSGIDRKPHREVANPHGLEGSQQVVQHDAAVEILARWTWLRSVGQRRFFWLANRLHGLLPPEA